MTKITQEQHNRDMARILKGIPQWFREDVLGNPLYIKALNTGCFVEAQQIAHGMIEGEANSINQARKKRGEAERLREFDVRAYQPESGRKSAAAI